MNPAEHTPIPMQESGASSDTISKKELPDERAAKLFFDQAAARLNDVSRWKEFAGIFTADFVHCDAIGEVVKRDVKEGDHFRIDGPGPSSVQGGGYDWVRVEKVEHLSSVEEDILLIRVHPAPNPKSDASDTAHFFTDESSSSFIIHRWGNTVYAEIHGRNEKPNVEAHGIYNKARNAVAGAVAAIFYSKFQWKALTVGLLDFELDGQQ